MKRTWLFLCTFVLLAVLVTGCTLDGRRAKFVSAEELAALCTGRTELPPEDAVLCRNGQMLPRAGEKAFLTVDSSFTLSGLRSLSAEGYRVYLDRSMEQTGLETLLREDIASDVYLISETGWTAVKLVFTYLPVITVRMSAPHITDAPASCDFCLYDGKNPAVASDAFIRVRGASSASLSKTGYRLELKQDREKNKLSLLGMRKDDDWILYPAQSDNTKVRDVVAWHLWEKMMAGQEYGGTLQTRYAELIVNGKYSGLYVLMERFDEKTLGLGEGDALFKCLSWEVPPSVLLRKQAADSDHAGCLEKKYPDPKDGVDGSWDVLADYVELCYESDNRTFAKHIAETASLENQLDYWLFLNMVMGADNTWKNTYFAQIGGKIYAYPWDLDITFGLYWNGVKRDNYVYEEPDTCGHSYSFLCGAKLIAYVPEARAYLKTRWAQLRQAGVADAEAIIADARAQWTLLHDCGAYRRNAERWPDTSTTDSLEYMEACIRTQTEWLDGFITNLR